MESFRRFQLFRFAERHLAELVLAQIEARVVFELGAQVFQFVVARVLERVDEDPLVAAHEVLDLRHHLNKQ